MVSCLFKNVTHLKLCKPTTQVATQTALKRRKEDGEDRELTRFGSISFSFHRFLGKFTFKMVALAQVFGALFKSY